MVVEPARFRFPLRAMPILCRRCAASVHPKELIMNERGDWRCLRCIEDERVRKPGAKSAAGVIAKENAICS